MSSAKAAALRPILFPSGPLPWLKPAVIVAGLVPLVKMEIDLIRGTLSADPVSAGENQLGLLALVFLVASLACTPLQTLFGWKFPIRIRKALGLYAFFYASLHFGAYLGFDKQLNMAEVFADLTERPFLIVGFLAFVILVPLAVTSTAGMLKRLGFKRWKALHRLAYVAGILGVAHFVMRVKSNLTEPVIYGTILGALFAVRLGAWLKERARARLNRELGLD